MQTWLVIFRGDPEEGGTPIGVVNDREISLAAVRAAWAEFQRVYREGGREADPVLREGVEGMERRLRAAAEDLAADAAEDRLTLKVLPRGSEGDDLAERVLAALQKSQDGLTTRAVRGAVRARDTDVDAALRRLEAAGRAKCAPRLRGALIWRAEGSWSGGAEKARPERGPAPGDGPTEPDVEPDGEGES